MLGDTYLTDDCLEGIEALESITHLDLSNNFLTDKALDHLKKMRQLQSHLDLAGLNQMTGSILDVIY